MGLGRPVELALPEGAEAPGQTSHPGGDIGEVRPIADEQGGTNGPDDPALPIPFNRNA